MLSGSRCQKEEALTALSSHGNAHKMEASQKLLPGEGPGIVPLALESSSSFFSVYIPPSFLGHSTHISSYNFLFLFDLSFIYVLLVALKTLFLTFDGFVFPLLFIISHLDHPGFPGGSAGKEPACHTGDLGLIPGLGRSSGKGKGYLLQYSGLENWSWSRT